jgi:hypothetical protein
LFGLKKPLFILFLFFDLILIFKPTMLWQFPKKESSSKKCHWHPSRHQRTTVILLTVVLEMAKYQDQESIMEAFILELEQSVSIF